MPALLALVSSLAIGLTRSPAQLPANPCSLLTASEIGAGFSGTLTPHPTDMEVPSGPSKGQHVKGCMWQAGESGMVAVSVAHAPQDAAARQAGLAMMEQTYNQLKSQGWTEEKQDFAGGKCAVLTPPAAQQDAPFTTGCYTEAKGLVVSVSWLGKNKAGIDKVKPLLDKVVGRLH